jgi:hypothetical protein
MLLPFGYGTEERSLDQVEARLLVNYHPEYVARLVAWMRSCDGRIGVGGGFRPDGTQPAKAGFAPAGKSFHQNQKYSDGFVGATAVDLVHRNPGSKHRSPTWAEVPAQGSAEAAKWGLHCNVGTPGARGSEPWHIQPVEIDGHQSWLEANSPCPKAGYTFPGRNDSGDDMAALNTPVRWFDTRKGSLGPLEGGKEVAVAVPIVGVKDIQINVAVTEPAAAGYVTVWSDGQRPEVSNINFVAGQTVSNGTLVKVGADGKVRFWPSTTTHLVVDIQGTSG